MATGSWAQCAILESSELPMNRPKDLGRTKMRAGENLFVLPNLWAFFRFRGSMREVCIGKISPHESLGTFNIQPRAPNLQEPPTDRIGCWMLGVECWMFSIGSGVQCAKCFGEVSSHPMGRGKG